MSPACIYSVEHSGDEEETGESGLLTGSGGF